MFAVHAARVDSDDPLSGLELGEQPEPAAADGWTTVSVRAASLNGHDLSSLRRVGLAQKKQWALVALDCAVDTRRRPGRRWRASCDLRSVRAAADRSAHQGGARGQEGERRQARSTTDLPQSVVRRIQRLRARGLSLRAIAEELNQADVPTAQGGRQWYAATVRGVLARSD